VGKKTNSFKLELIRITKGLIQLTKKCTVIKIAYSNPMLLMLVC